jgi:hypothetical protein
MVVMFAAGSIMVATVLRANIIVRLLPCEREAMYTAAGCRSGASVAAVGGAATSMSKVYAARGLLSKDPILIT